MMSHPRGRRELPARVRLVEPRVHLDFLSLACDAAPVLTDSGRVQEETIYLGILCFTLCANTERPVTIRQGTDKLLGFGPERIREVPTLLAAHGPEHADPPPWEGRPPEPAVDIIAELGRK
jgi:UDP-N-acetylglucosamine 2-epimerase (non-hydrolysing)